MQSLAILVSIIIAIMIAAGSLALLLTFLKTKEISNVTIKPLQRIITIFLALISLIIGLLFVTQVDSLGGRVIGGFGIAASIIAFYRVFNK